MESLKFQNLSEENLYHLKALKENIEKESLESQQKEIFASSPYSNAINKYIKAYDELYYYTELELSESVITRPALIKEIDLDLWISSKGKTNKELLDDGLAPFAYDSEDGEIELHHIGQAFEAPFAELTKKEHIQLGNNKLLHFSDQESWRNNKNKLNAYQNERRKYWQMRATSKVTILNSSKKIENHPYTQGEETGKLIREIIETLYDTCSIKDLDFLRDLAKNYILIKQNGSKTIEEFIVNERSNQDANYSLCCTYCGSKKYVAYGKYVTFDETIQRYKCSRCKRTFTSHNQSLISGCSFSLMQWLRFIDCLYNGYSCKQTAEICDVTEATVHNYRKRLFYALQILDNQVVLQNNVVIDESYLPISYKGNRSKQEDFVLPRHAHKRGGENSIPGVSKEKICIVCALDDYGNSVARIAGKGGATSRRLNIAISNAITPENVKKIFSDKEEALKSYAKSKGIEIKQTLSVSKYKKTKRDRQTLMYLQMMNSYHSRLKRFLSKFVGISSELLPGYLYLFSWKERNKYREPIEAYKELLLILTDNKYCVSPEQLDERIRMSFKKSYMPTKTITKIERAHKIYALFAEGQTKTAIGKKYNLSTQRVSKIINDYRELGLAYKTQKDLEQEQKSCTPKSRLPKFSTIERDKEIYLAKQSLKPEEIAEFYSKTSKKYNLSIQRIKNIISEQARIEALAKEFYIWDEVEYRDLKTQYNNIYNYYVQLKMEDPNRSERNITITIAEETGYGAENILRIINIMKDQPKKIDWSRKKTGTLETLQRDKAIFIDFLKWRGTENDFCIMVQNKYGIAKITTKKILSFNYKANIERFYKTHD